MILASTPIKVLNERYRIILQNINSNVFMQFKNVILKYAEHVNKEGDDLIEVFEQKSAGNSLTPELEKKNANR